MLKDFVKAAKPEEEEFSKRLEEERAKLFASQMKIKEAGLPVMVMFEGWGAAGKGSVLGKIIKNIDPRFFRVKTFPKPTKEELRYPFLYRYMKEIPEKGKFAFYDTFWMEEITDARVEDYLEDDEYEEMIDSINKTERTLVDNGYLVMKFFFHISRKEQKERLEKLLDDKDTKWRVDKGDLYENKHYDDCLEVYDQYLKDTNNPTAPWYIIDSKDKKFAELQVLEFLNQGIETALKNHNIAAPILQNTFKLKKTPLLKDVDLKDKTLTDEEYEKRLDELIGRLYGLKAVERDCVLHTRVVSIKGDDVLDAHADELLQGKSTV